MTWERALLAAAIGFAVWFGLGILTVAAIAFVKACVVQHNARVSRPVEVVDRVLGVDVAPDGGLTWVVVAKRADGTTEVEAQGRIPGPPKEEQ